MPESKNDKRLALGYGSAWHLLRCLGWQRTRFSALIAGELDATHITWLDFNSYKGDRIYPSGMQIRDNEWKRIDFIEDDQIQQAYDRFWPSRGEQQNWDAIGKAMINGREEWILVEAKAHPTEIMAIGTTAKENGGRPMIRIAFRETLEALGYDADSASSWVEHWLTGYYQQANRLATLHFFVKNGIPTRLIFLYFCGDQHPDGKFCPVNRTEWQPSLNKVHTGLGLNGTSELEKRVYNIFVHVDLARENSLGVIT
jgi:hypothetical protein